MSGKDHKVLGIDPSTTSCGWAVLEHDGKLAGSGVFAYSEAEQRKTQASERIRSIAWRLAEVFALFRPSFVFAEHPWVGKNSKVALVMGELKGALQFALYVQSGCKAEVNWMQPKEWRKSLGVTGKQDKQGGLDVVCQLMRTRGIPFGEFVEDEVEAIGVAEAGRLEVQGWFNKVNTTEEVKTR